ncbi:MAG TPA: gfo/Idh/MocA family oxidoreductase, partial [Phycisphaerae bacterium]|nr:gfo/Idh/MocA family oxidoreductase [Phycisphaerae bacterium]
GRIHRLEADLGFQIAPDPLHRVFNRELGGGCLLDVGVYPLSLAIMLLGVPQSVRGRATIGATGVDECNTMELDYDNGVKAMLSASIREKTPQHVHVWGEVGELHMHGHWWKGGPFSVKTSAGTREFDIPLMGSGYHYEADDVSRCIFAGATESGIMPLSQSVNVLKIADSLRSQWGLRYPGETGMT